MVSLRRTRPHSDTHAANACGPVHSALIAHLRAGTTAVLQVTTASRYGGTITLHAGEVVAVHAWPHNGETALRRLFLAKHAQIVPLRVGAERGARGDTVHTATLLARVAAECTALTESAGAAGGLDRVWSRRDPSLRALLDVPEAARATLQLIDGRRSVRELLIAGGLAETVTLRILTRLCQTRVLVPPDAALHADADDDAVPAPEPRFVVHPGLAAATLLPSSSVALSAPPSLAHGACAFGSTPPDLDGRRDSGAPMPAPTPPPTAGRDRLEGNLAPAPFASDGATASPPPTVGRTTVPLMRGAFPRPVTIEPLRAPSAVPQRAGDQTTVQATDDVAAQAELRLDAEFFAARPEGNAPPRPQWFAGGVLFVCAVVFGYLVARPF